MKALNELSKEQLNYLQQKWASEAKELERRIFRAKQKLQCLITKQTINNIFLTELRTELNNSKMLLKHLHITASPRTIREVQQQIVDKLQQQYNKAAIALNLLTEEEAQLKQAAIDELELFKSYREIKVATIEKLLSDTSNEKITFHKVEALADFPLDKVSKKAPLSATVAELSSNVYPDHFASPVYLSFLKPDIPILRIKSKLLIRGKRMESFPSQERLFI